MRVLAAALSAATLAILPVHAAASTPNAAPEQAKSETDAVGLNDNQPTATADAELTTGAKKPGDHAPAETSASAGPKPDQSAQASANEREASPTKS